MKYWIVSSEGKILENVFLDEFESYPISVKLNFPLDICFCYYKRFIYFMDGSHNLIRIKLLVKNLKLFLIQVVIALLKLSKVIKIA